MDATTAAALIEECIAYETRERDAADASEKHYWNGWSEEDMRAGTPIILVTASAPGLGRVTTFVYSLMIKGASGKYGSVRDVHLEKVPTGRAARYNGREGFATRRAAALYGKGITVSYKALV